MPVHSRKHAPPVLLLVDFINHFKFAGGERLAPRAVAAARATARLKADMRRAGSMCVYVNDNFGEWRTEFSALLQQCGKIGGESQEIAELLRPSGGDLSVLKPRHSGFYGTPLDFLLQELRASTLVITGIAVDMCVMATAMDAHVRKFRIRVPANCVAGFSAADEAAALAIMARTMDAKTAPHRRARPARGAHGSKRARRPAK